MKGPIKISIGWVIILIICSTSYPQKAQADRYHQKADKYWDQAQKLKEQRKYREAVQFYEKSAEAEQQSPRPRVEYLADEIGMAGYCYKQMGEYEKAFEYYERALHINRKLDREVDIAINLSHIGEIHYMWGQYAEALTSFEQALELDRKLGREVGMTIRLNNIGTVYNAWGQYDKAIEYYKRSLEIARKIGQDAEIAGRLNNIGMVYKKWGKYDKALEYFEQALELSQKLDSDADIAVTLNNLGAIYEDRGLYDKALQYYQQALEIDRKLGRNVEISIRLSNIGNIYSFWGQYDKAIEHYEQSLKIDRKLWRKAGIAVTLNNIGDVYRMWGQYTKALDYYKQSLEMEKELGRDAEIATRLNNIGEVHSALRQYPKALEYYQQALELDRKFDRNADVAVTLNNIGAIYEHLEQDEKAIEYYQQALQIQLKLDMFSGIAVSANNIGMIYETWELYDDALVFYNQALTVVRKLGDEASIAIYLHNIGVLYYDQKNYPEAIPYFIESVDLLEKLRKTAPGDVRRDYLASQIHTYQFLISCYVRIGDFVNAFKIIELSRAKRLEERLAGSSMEFSAPSLESIQQSLPEDTAICIYATTVDENMVQMLMTKEKLIASERVANEFMQKLITSDQVDTATASVDSRGLEIGQKKTQQDGGAPDEKKPLGFTTLIKQYREQLLDLSFSRGLNLQEQDVSTRHDESKDAGPPNLNKHLYAFLLGDIQEHLHGKIRLLILPDGVLNFLPFETLTDDQGKYLVETYQITYAQSLGVLGLIGQREYEPDRKPLLAFGGAVYEEQGYQEEMSDNEAQLAYLQKQVDLALKRGSSLRTIYAKLGRGEWENLPGTLVEVKAIQDVVEGAELMTGADVHETTVKALSAHGQLANYKILHFATHGAVDPVIPELSALVLSSPGSTGVSPVPGSASVSPALEGSGMDISDAGETPALPEEEMPALPREEDGYLRAREIVNLDLKADFVNLSACETGLGKLYSGEGIVGLTQAFLLAGANGLSVSLWSVADESTAQFMVAVYTLVEEEGLSYADAITEIKRRFIHGDFGDAWKTPYFWAPFVYYGK